jgi:hypothetical protein
MARSYDAEGGYLRLYVITSSGQMIKGGPPDSLEGGHKGLTIPYQMSQRTMGLQDSSVAQAKQERTWDLEPSAEGNIYT